MRKTRQAQSSAFTPMQNLALSWTPGTQDKVIIPNQEISTDWGIINKKLQAGQDNVFALYLDLNTGWVAACPKANRGLAGEILAQYCQEFGTPKSILHDNAQEYLHGDFANLCREKQITQRMSAPHTPNQNPTEHYMDIIVGKTRCLLYISGLESRTYWVHALHQATCLQNRTALPGRPTPYQNEYGKKLDISRIRIFGCEALAYVEKEKRHKLDFKTERCIYLGMPSRHSPDTHKLLKLSNNEVVYRRNVSFNERCFPARTQRSLLPLTSPIIHLRENNLMGQTFTQDQEHFIITGTSCPDGIDCIEYQNTDTKEEHYSTRAEVVRWVKQSKIRQLANNIQPFSRKGFVNTSAELMFKELHPTKYDVKLASNKVKPPKSYNEAQGREQQWFEAFRKERDGMLRFNTWTRIKQQDVTPEMRKHALHAHHIYNVKRDGSAKVRVVVNGKRQHDSTFSDTTSPVISQFQLRTFLAVTSHRQYHMVQMNLTNAYLHADIQDRVFISITIERVCLTSICLILQDVRMEGLFKILLNLSSTDFPDEPEEDFTERRSNGG
jgi:hypothetical protein